jgi:hypothetical protein
MPGSSPGMTIEFFSYTPLPQNTESLETVIASEAKQSISPRKERMDCFASLAMTAP